MIGEGRNEDLVHFHDKATSLVALIVNHLSFINKPSYTLWCRTCCNHYYISIFFFIQFNTLCPYWNMCISLLCMVWVKLYLYLTIFRQWKKSIDSLDKVFPRNCSSPQWLLLYLEFSSGQVFIYIWCLFNPFFNYSSVSFRSVSSSFFLHSFCFFKVFEKLTLIFHPCRCVPSLYSSYINSNGLIRMVFVTWRYTLWWDLQRCVAQWS